MSIATNEVGKLPIRANIYKKADLRNNTITFEGAKAVAEAAYIAGRTAEVTVGEVTSAAYALWKTDANMASIQPSEEEYAEAWWALLPAQREMYEHKAFMALEAARKAVTE